MQAKAILKFWFEEIETKKWWVKDPEFDQLILSRFGEIHAQAVKSELFSWRSKAQDQLAEIIILDQFSRNIYRDTPSAFATDPLALALAQAAIEKGFDHKLPPRERAFMYMPFMHSESRLIHEISLKLFQAEEVSGNLDFAIKHKAIIDRFGRYPHRNQILGRSSTPEEIAFLKEPNSSF
ncbi:DUF924 domain-containing protein [bacterium (Candidatus Blackallbacteria) CG17_big_fil_post_rev_8_21_14_2_50_48_46]|uniref:DUF924 domain-containing protein n=1 Tax=bacterium (Candidatus Blackallbacteria) CG17_big_fil_post_rev_8_21_14_2_50_48_46 TaxID=2014261 RepID=A0A2M7G5F8_9BACT|nr:MAG: hypothetical protein COW64_01730 [bacterium (Candidatus Blackallbacteria) CG18_big_fil_WC_8_21_14_2_50_49_26]PIW17231.1 MAG: DUF924 domain-containing protein [bacterium (Candidatus Blackallbacteria) CG17_big_fil_post_rev_8_21_14_2_50_48_46]PIW51022.1 MAG: DUF924 domain-containing protein [bacterium (Candidatus Blackallbacteria) CG13_big_fil_rev_8_21_14_2_50_49_14]